MTMETKVKVRISTGAGPLAIVGTEKGVTEIYFEGSPSASRLGQGETRPSGDAPRAIPEPVRDAVHQLQQYFKGERREFQFKMHYEGTDFQRRVWAHLLTIPPGTTQTYGEVAQALGNPKGARAVGGAVGRNPISVAIPCHRVVGADGKGGGYGGGMAAKRLLLQLEGVALPGGKGGKEGWSR